MTDRRELAQLLDQALHAIEFGDLPTIGGPWWSRARQAVAGVLDDSAEKPDPKAKGPLREVVGISIVPSGGDQLECGHTLPRAKIPAKRRRCEVCRS